MSRLLTFSILCMTILPQSSFRQAQRQYTRVEAAYLEKESIVKSYFDKQDLSQQNYSLFIRAFKKEMTLEVWVKPKDNEKFTILHTYDFCTTSGVYGPKRKEGDLQIPEGEYYINHFQPTK